MHMLSRSHTQKHTQICASQWRRVMFQVMWGRCLCVWDSRREQSACLAPLSCMARQAAASHWLGTQWEPDCTHSTLPTSKTCDIHDYQTEDKTSDWERHQMSVDIKMFLQLLLLLFFFYNLRHSVHVKCIVCLELHPNILLFFFFFFFVK